MEEEEETVMVYRHDSPWKEMSVTFEPQHYYKPVGTFAKEVFYIYFCSDNLDEKDPLDDDKFIQERVIPCFQQVLTLGWALPNVVKETVKIIETYEKQGRLHPNTRNKGQPKIKGKIWNLLREINDTLDDSFSHVAVLEPTRLRYFTSRVDKGTVICKLEFTSNYTFVEEEGMYIRRQRVISKCFQSSCWNCFIPGFVLDEKARIELYYLQKVAYSILPDVLFLKYIERYISPPARV